ncbi:MAG: hypothetical protein WA652_06190, partial [Xanthobacteraceae bacterium]
QEMKSLWILLRTNAALLALTLLFFGTPNGAFADNWLIARSSTSGSCNVQLETSRPYLGVPLNGRYPTRKAACQQASTLKTSDPADSSKCFDYLPATVTGCLADGVTLPK